MAQYLNVHKYNKFKIGTDLYCIVTYYSYEQIPDHNIAWVHPYIESYNDIFSIADPLNPSDPYNSSNDFTIVGYSDDKINWYTYSSDIPAVDLGWNNLISYRLDDNNNLPELDLSNTILKRIPAFMFYFWHCRELKLPNSVEYIGFFAFASLTIYSASTIVLSGPRTLKLPYSLTFIDSYAFYNCNSITTIDFSNSILTINDLNNNTTIFLADTDIIDTTIILGDQSLRNDVFWLNQNRNCKYINPTYYKYVCHDSVNGDQQFPLYENPPSSRPYKIYNIVVNGVSKNLYLSLVNISDTANGGNRVQYIDGVGAYRYRKTTL